MAEILGEIVFWILYWTLGIPAFYTGEVLLYVFSLGRRKPRWDVYARDQTVRGGILGVGSLLLGASFWVAVIVVAVVLLVGD